PSTSCWRISLHATEHGHTYNVYALYKGEVIGKLRVVSYRAQHHTVTIVPVNQAQPDTASIERYLNRVYGPVGVSFTVRLDERMRGNVSWSAAGDGRLSLVGLDLFGNEAERRESPEMRRLQAAYAQAAGGLPAGSGCYLFVLDGESGLDPTAHLLGEMPRRSRFGYLFSPDGRGMERTIAHELGHGLFTLQHTFDPEYGGPASRGTTRNLMDYGTDADTALAAFQWNIMASPAVFTLLDDGEDGREVLYDEFLIAAKTGLTPDGRVIQSCVSTDSAAYRTVFVINHNVPDRIYGFQLRQADGSKLGEYLWNGHTYYDSAHHSSIEETTHIILRYNTLKTVLETRVYRPSYNRCTYQYADVQYDPTSRKILTPDNARVWYSSYLWNASESCRTSFIKEILASDRAGCDGQRLAEGQKLLASIRNSVSAEQIVNMVSQCCLDALRALPYSTLADFLTRVAAQERLTESSELAVLRLMNAMNGNDYAQFYQLLEKDNNKLLRHLVDQMDDASIWFWTDKENYTNFIGALVWMFNCDAAKSITDRWPDNIEEYAQRVINMEPVTYEDIQYDWLNVHWSTKHNAGAYDATTGEITLQDVYTTYSLQTFSEGMISQYEHKDVVATVSPLTPILIVPSTNKLPLIETALGGDALPGQMYVVPAIFLKYNHDKIRNDYIEKGIVTTLDVATIALSGGTALATKVHWVRRAWALAEVAGAVGNIAVNTQAISSPKVKEAVDIYNAAMGLIGLKNIGQGGYKFVKNLPEQTKKLLQKSERLREGLQQGYLNWKALAKNLDNLTDAEKQLITEQEQVWRVLGMFDDIKGVNNLSILKTLKGIIPTGNKLTNIRYSDFVKGFDA
ncbi:MAG: hypothetical protein IJT48_11615, partial [Bacteroidaceae bacterium]|nr:hypothetical protein [Bacteroidaceae bacterium]